MKKIDKIINWIILLLLLYIVIPPLFEHISVFVNNLHSSSETVVKGTITTASQKLNLNKTIEHTWYAYLTGTDTYYNTWSQFFTWGGPKPSLTDYLTCKNVSPTWTKTYVGILSAVGITIVEHMSHYYIGDQFTANLVIRIITSIFT